MSAIHKRHHHLQIAQQFRDACRHLRFRFRLALRLEEQIRCIEDALTDCGRTIAPGGIQLPGLPRFAVILCEHRGHPLAVFQIDARHRHQKLHRHVGADLSCPHLLLDHFR